MLALTLDGTLFEFEKTKPQLEPLFALPPKSTPQEIANLNFFYYSTK